MLASFRRPEELEPPAWSASVRADRRDLWNEVASRLQEALNEHDLPHLVRRGERRSSLDDDAFVLAVPNDFTREWIEAHFLGLIRAPSATRPATSARVQVAVGPTRRGADEHGGRRSPAAARERAAASPA